MPTSYPDSRIDATLAEMKPKFTELFKADPSEVEWLFFTFAPGRVNFYGEHTDYMGGFVCPGGLREGCHILCGRIAKYSDAKLRFGTTKDQYFEFTSVGEVEHNKDWSTFATGAACIMLGDLGMSLSDPALQGICFLSHGSLSMGSGMSASASYDVALLNALRSAALGTYKARPQTQPGHYPELDRGDREDKIKLTKQAQLIETKYCGVNVGIMDQFSSVHATEGKFMALDCDALTFNNHEIGNITGPDGCFLLINSMVRHELSSADHGSGYNAIRSAIEGAEEAVSKTKLGGAPFKFCHIARNPTKFTTGDPVQFVAECKSAMSATQYERGVFNVAEQVRTIEFIALSEPSCPLSQPERYARAGELLNATHVGQRDALGISTPELDFIQEAINKEEGVAGGRLMGGGFGGCIVMLLKRNAVDRVVANVQAAFKEKFGITPEAYPVELCDGAFVVSLWNGASSAA
ncbi:Galactokinase-like protein [Novymonas esmeraldas]|uniref:Galactokinase-like protein n=1 Tax=Novymonas esmeraldas TaxID=1808958 RepID=A0AAW0F3W4_9TRYP